tara:strand:- start:14368 stop:16659 length:2292 start_codon:yes stop_codon:yes gene_type:complete
MSEHETTTDEPVGDRKDEANDAKPYLDMLKAAEQSADYWNQSCDKAKENYADLKKLRRTVKGNQEFQIYWANMEVIKPSIYSRPPTPVVTPAFKSRKPLERTASEVLERLAIANMKKVDGHRQLLLVRDDLALYGRGVIWVRHENDDYAGECAPFDHLLRENFLHDPQKNWSLVTWVARAGWFTKDKAKKRFKGKHIDWDEVSFVEGETDTPESYKFQKTAKVWQIWDKDAKEVIWVAEGCNTILEQGPPPVKLKKFFPCPEPAFGTIQPDTLTSIPDYLFYADQIDEINTYTTRINNLTEQLKLKGFYEAGKEEVAVALQRALDTFDDKIIVPITGLSAIDGNRDLVQWLPLGEIIQAVQALVEIRQNCIGAIYEITGISDIMRGQTSASETLGAQQLKTQYGNVRIRSKQEEMVRIGKEAIEIAAEIAAENFSQKTIQMMARVEIPTEAEVQEQVAQQLQQIEEQALQATQQARNAPPPQQPQPGQPPQGQPQQPPQPNPQQIIEMAQQEGQRIQQQAAQEITYEKVIKFFRDERLAPYALDIETDSTIQADEQAEKENRTQFTAAIGQFLNQATQLVAAAPETGPLVGELLQFSTAPWRVGRQLESTIDELVDTLAQKAKAAAENQGGPSPEEMAAQADAKAKADEGEAKKAEAQAKLQEQARKDQEALFKAQQAEKDNEAKRQAQLIEANKKAEADVARAERKAAAEDARAENEHKRRMENLAAEDLRNAEKHAKELEKMSAQAAHQERTQAAKEQNND